MVPSKLKTDLKKLAQLRNVDDLKKQLAQYEQRVLEVVREVDLKGREARKKGEAQLFRFATQIRERRSSIEKQLRDIVTKERERLNEGIGDLLSHLKNISIAEKATASSSVRSAPKKTKATAAKKAPVRKRASGAAARKKGNSPSPVSPPAH